MSSVLGEEKYSPIEMIQILFKLNFQKEFKFEYGNLKFSPQLQK